LWLWWNSLKPVLSPRSGKPAVTSKKAKSPKTPLEKGKVPKDPWGNDFVYLSPGLKGDFDIISYGLDGVPGGEEENKDINNWEIE
jgi:general secretion pathway protein G